MRIRCKTHVDCTSSAEFFAAPFGKTFALCDKGYCVSLLANKKCNRVNDCGYHHSCMNGKCVLGGAGAKCMINSINCVPGYACDEKTRRCVKGVAGVTCRDKDECGFGNSCYQVLPLPRQRAQRQGTCRPGTLDTYACRRDSHCVGKLRCLSKTITTRDRLFTEYKCARLTNFRRSRFPFGFRRCATDNQCGPGLNCLRRRCQPIQLGQFCNFDFIAANRQCSTFTACVNRKCVYAKEGDTCYSETGGMNSQCAPGFRCTAPRNVGLGRPGICTKGVEGNKCDDGSECAKGLVCGTSKICTRSAVGQRCRSNYWCPAGLECHMYTNRCARPSDVPARARYPAVRRAPKCHTRVDCPQQTIGAVRNMFCLNGVCLPRSLGWTCFSSSRYDGTFCDGGIEIEGTLGKRCQFSRHCLFGLVCENGTCVKSAINSACGSDYNCQRGQVCDIMQTPNVCAISGRGGECRSNAQCKRPLRCVMAIDQVRSGRCV